MPEERNRVEAIFAALMEITEPAARAAYLDKECRGDESMQREVESLLAAHDGAGDFLEGPSTAVAEHAPESLCAEKPSDRIGRYKLLEQIGEGGFGVV